MSHNKAKPNRAERRRLAFNPTLADSERVDVEKHGEEREKREAKKAAIKEGVQPSWQPGPAEAVLVGDKKKRRDKPTHTTNTTTTTQKSPRTNTTTKRSGAALSDLLKEERNDSTTQKKRKSAEGASGGAGAGGGKKKVSVDNSNGKKKNRDDGHHNNSNTNSKRRRGDDNNNDDAEEDNNDNNGNDTQQEPAAVTERPLVLMQGMDATDDFVFFFKGWPGAWYKARFAVHGESYNSLEQFLCASKARMFGNDEVLTKVMASPQPQEQHNIAKHFKPFDADKWAQELPDLLYVGNLAKFSQVAGLKRALLSTGEREFVECNPRDMVSGIGLGLKHKDREDRSLWKGRNLMGVALGKVRADIRSGDYMDVAEDEEGEEGSDGAGDDDEY